MAGINKRSCGAFLSPDLKLSANSGIIHCRAIKYIIKSEVRLIGHRRLLILYLIPQRNAAEGDYSPAYAIFQSCDSFAACDMTDKGHPKWRAAGLERLEPNERSFTERLAFYSRADETRVIRFCAAHREKIQCKTGVILRRKAGRSASSPGEPTAPNIPARSSANGSPSITPTASSGGSSPTSAAITSSASAPPNTATGSTAAIRCLTLGTAPADVSAAGGQEPTSASRR